MYDTLISGGTVVDGTGAAPLRADIAIKGGTIVAIAPTIGGDASQRVDATGKLVLPGFVDVHTHYDGQATWDSLLEPSSAHGVTTIVMGNCGVGFAPTRPGAERWLIELMAGVEDIPIDTLDHAMSWGWESYADYLDALGQRRWSVDVASQITHGAVRGYVMGERGARNEQASPHDIDAMAGHVREAIEAGAVGFSTSRVIEHRAMNGDSVPGTFADDAELFALGRAVHAGGGGVFEVAPAGIDGSDLSAPASELAWMRRMSAEVGIRVAFGLMQFDTAPDMWRRTMDDCLSACADNAELYPLIAARPFGMLLGLQTYHPFGLKPTFKAELAHLPIGERAARMRERTMRARLLTEPDDPPTALFDRRHHNGLAAAHKLFVLGDPPDYEPTPERTVAAIASASGRSLLETFYDLLLEDDGKQFFLLPVFNYSHGNGDALYEQLTHPRGIIGLGDGGAHCGIICDASVTTYLLTHWCRDRSRGARLPLELLVRKHTHDTAQLYGFTDRGTLAPGQRADINVVDHGALTLHPPELVHDLPAGGRRLLQRATGYELTMVAGEITRRNGVDTGARPCRLGRRTGTR